jgi:hypothetical protein
MAPPSGAVGPAEVPMKTDVFTPASASSPEQTEPVARWSIGTLPTTETPPVPVVPEPPGGRLPVHATIAHEAANHRAPNVLR